MQKLQFKIEINAPKEKVWKTMLDDETYRQWTEMFGPGSHYIGDWKEGSKIVFLAPDEKGDLSGMIGKIKENRPNQFVSIEYVGIIDEGREDISSEETEKWNGALENYTLQEKEGVTELIVDVDVLEEYRDIMQESWPEALNKLKDLAEN
ncbi:MAG: SRPBCC domain-containing protein [Methanobacterium sp.]|nr:SRPBCC domain-containing protein [Methanobacterium sp.]